jgi:VanZ family protein
MTVHPASPFAEHGALARGAFTVVVLLSLAVLFTPASDVPSAAPGVDKLVHLSLFAALAVTGRWAGVRREVLAVLLVLYAAVSELLQSLDVLSRSTSVADWLADVVGVLVGLLAWDLLSRRRASARR